MVIDTSVLIALQMGEPGHRELARKIGAAPVVVVGAPTMFEATMVLVGKVGDEARLLVDQLMRQLDAEVVPFTREHYESAGRAFLRYGKGRHPAALNFGDCMAYAVASVSGLPLLYTGNDFSRTDVRRA